MEKFDIFLKDGDKIKYENTYYCDPTTKEVVKVKEDSISFKDGELTLMKMLLNS